VKVCLDRCVYCRCDWFVVVGSVDDADRWRFEVKVCLDRCVYCRCDWFVVVGSVDDADRWRFEVKVCIDRCAYCRCDWSVVVGSVDDADRWRFEARLGQSLSVKVDAFSVGVTGSDEIDVDITAAAAFISPDSSLFNIDSSTQLKVRAPLCV